MTRLAIIGTAALVLILLARDWHLDRVRDAREAGRAEIRAQVEADRADTERLARAAEAAQRVALDAVAHQYEQEKDDAKVRSDAVAAGLRAGNLRLREQWQGCENAAARVPATPAAAGQPDALAELRAASAGRIVHAGADADAQIRGLQAVVRACTAGQASTIERD